MDWTGNLEPGARFNAMSAAQGWAGHCDRTLAFRRPELAAMSALWHQAAGDGPIPKRADMGPRALKGHLPNVVIYERLNGGDTYRYRVRLMGTQFAQVMGELTGKFIDSALPAEFVMRWNTALDSVLEAGIPLRFVSRSDTAGKPFLVGEFFEAPLLADDGAMNLVIAAGIFTPAESWQGFLPGRATPADIGGLPV
jgi:hypothetical protein